VACIAGAAGGQGGAEALRLAAEGADIVAFDIYAPIPGRDMVPAATRDDLAETERCVMAVVGDTETSLIYRALLNPPPSPRALHLPHRREFNRDD
jgi:hypothetical protein